jgi:hypothetical protein
MVYMALPEIGLSSLFEKKEDDPFSCTLKGAFQAVMGRGFFVSGFSLLMSGALVELDSVYMLMKLDCTTSTKSFLRRQQASDHLAA